MDMKIRQDKKKWCISVPGKKQTRTYPQTLSIFYNKLSTKNYLNSRVQKKTKQIHSPQLLPNPKKGGKEILQLITE